MAGCPSPPLPLLGQAPSPMTTATPDSYEQRSRAEQLAIWTLRRIGQDNPSPFSAHQRRPSGVWEDLEEIVDLLRAANRRLQEERGAGLGIGSPGHLGITGDERAFLRAATAAQIEAEDLLTAELASFLAGSRTRFLFRRAVSLLAAVLAAHDHWLPQPVAEGPLLACAALDLARRQGRDWRHARVMWP